jgi:hypothetical protein
MVLKEYFELFRYLIEQRHLRQDDIAFVENISDWCKEHDIPEPDKEKPLKLISEDGRGRKMLIKESVPEEIIDERIHAVRIRNQVVNVAFSKADMLDTVHKKLAFLFLDEFAYSLPEVDDDLLADNWAFQEIERLGHFNGENEKGLKQA